MDKAIKPKKILKVLSISRRLRWLSIIFEKTPKPDKLLGVGLALHLVARYLMKGVLTIKEAVECLEKLSDEQRLDVLLPLSSPVASFWKFCTTKKVQIGCGLELSSHRLYASEELAFLRQDPQE
jgi:hypothetical protein